MTRKRASQAAATATATRATRRVVLEPSGVDEALPRWLPAVVYALITVLLFREFFFGDAMLFGTDTYALSYYAREYYTNYVHANGHFPLWQPRLYGGLPFLDSMHGDIFYPVSLALFFLDARSMWGWKIVLHVFLAGLFMYLWLRGLGLRRGSAFLGGLIFMMGADLVSLVYPGGDGKLFVSALAPLMFWLTDRAARLGRISDFAAFALGLAVVMFTSHMQLAYFTVWAVSLYFLYRVWMAWRSERDGAVAAKRMGKFAIAGALAVAAAAIQFLPPLGYLRSWSQRADKTLQAEAGSGYEYSTQWSLHPEEIASLVVPDFVGDNAPSMTRSGQTYWGRNPFKLNHEYAGLIPLLLLPLLLAKRRNSDVIFFTSLAALALLYALGATTPLFRLFYLIPGVNLFRAPSLIIFVYGLSIATLGAMGFQLLGDSMAAGEAEKKSTRNILWLVAAVFGFLAVLASGGAVTGLWQALFDVGPAQLGALQQNIQNIKVGFWIAFLLALALASAAQLRARNTFSAGVFLAAVCLIAAVDLYRVDRWFISASVAAQQGADPVMFSPDGSVEFLRARQAESPPLRVADIGAYGTNVLAMNGLEQLAGHHGNEMGRYRDLIGGDSPQNLGVTGHRLLDVASVEYLTVPPQQSARVSEVFPDLAPVFTGERSVVFQNPGALPRAYLVSEAITASDDVALPTLYDPAFDPATTALIADPLPGGHRVEPGASGSVEWVSHTDTESTVVVDATADALLVITENYYPSWRAEVDGAAAPVVRANLVFKAVPVPAGRHTVHVYYSADSLRTPALISGVTLIVLLLALVAPAVSRIGARKRAEPSMASP